MKKLLLESLLMGALYASVGPSIVAYENPRYANVNNKGYEYPRYARNEPIVYRSDYQDPQAEADLENVRYESNAGYEYPRYARNRRSRKQASRAGYENPRYESNDGYEYPRYSSNVRPVNRLIGG